jgi:hypothetical protein
VDLADEGRGLRAAADRPTLGQDVGRGVDEQDERPVEGQAVDDGVECATEQLVEIERRAEAGGQLVERDELGEPALELGAREGRLGGFADERAPLLVDERPVGGGLARPAGRGRAVQDEAGREQGRADDRQDVPPGRTGEQHGQDRERSADADEELETRDARAGHRADGRRAIGSGRGGRSTDRRSADPRRRRLVRPRLGQRRSGDRGDRGHELEVRRLVLHPRR